MTLNVVIMIGTKPRIYTKLYDFMKHLSLRCRQSLLNYKPMYVIQPKLLSTENTHSGTLVESTVTCVVVLLSVQLSVPLKLGWPLNMAQGGLVLLPRLLKCVTSPELLHNSKHVSV